MGMYTGLRMKGVVKPEWRRHIGDLDNRTEYGGWCGVRHPIAQEWAKVGRANFIPFGGLAYMPDGWSKKEDGEAFSDYNQKTGEWEFCCSLKNYENEIRKFCTEIAPHIFQSIEYAESFYEEGDYPDDINNWKLVIEAKIGK